jgi:hypothetical protein
MNYKVTTMKKRGKAVPITKLRDFVEFKKGDASLINRVITKTRH